MTGCKQYAPRTFDLLGIPRPSEFTRTNRSGILFATLDARDFWERIHPEDRARVEEALRRAYDPDSGAEGVYEAEYRAVLADGEDRWISSKGRVTFDETGRRPLRLAGLLRDITDRKREQQTLQQLAAVVENSAEFIGIATLDGHALFVNEAGRRLVGLPDKNAVRQTRVTDYFFPEDVPAAQDAARQALETGNGSLETRFRHFVTGEAIDVLWNLIAIYDTGTKQPYALATITRDMREQKRIEAERAEIAAKRERVAEAIQHSLLLVPPPDAYPGITVKPFYQAAWDDALIGGDFFDVFAVSEDVIALIVGDATGKGVEAATYTAEIKFALRAFLREHRGDLPTALRLLNTFVVDNERLDAAHIGASYVALAAVLINTRNGAVSCCCAGAEPPLIRRASTHMVEEASVCGRLLGVSDDTQYDVLHLVLETGDLLAMVTDGITEARTPPVQSADGKIKRGEFFGIEGLAAALAAEAANPDRSLADVEHAVVTQALEWAGGHQHDDICLLIARRL